MLGKTNLPSRIGRPKGALNKKTQAARQIVEEMGFDPLRFLVRTAKSRKLPREVRMEAAKFILPFIHPRLQATQITGKDEGPIEVAQLTAIMEDPKLAAALESIALALAGHGDIRLPDSNPAPIDVEPEAAQSTLEEMKVNPQ